MDPMTIISKIRAKRARAGISQASLAKQAGVSTDLLVRLENGRHKNPTYKTVSALESALSFLTQKQSTKHSTPKASKKTSKRKA